ncbi:uncharacterized protein LOC134719587 [Mytilus trossulus]|uniref:uncharacterized protein LOC134719587 n=1 Tax=Mytilus trossulus TaxID=6551 RepID=UPI0030061C46
MKVMTKSNSAYDPAHGHTEPDNNQQAYLMNSPDTIHLSISHAAVATNEVSNTYSHSRNTVDDPDVMYDHTIRHTVRNTGDGDYGITHRILTEGDYDVSGNYRQSLNSETDPVYN